MPSPVEPLFPRGAPHNDANDEERAADVRTRSTRAQSSSGAGPKKAVLPLALGFVAASLLVYLCAALLDPSPLTSRLALRVAGLDPASSRRTKSHSKLPDYLSSFASEGSSSGSESSESSGSRNSAAAAAAALMAAAEVAASDSILPLLPPPPPPRSSSSRSPPRVHVIVTSNGSPYLNYQTRLLFASWQRVKEREARGEFSSSSSSSASTSSPTTPTTATMAGFTRILHRTRDDALVREVPTLRVAPRTPSCDGWCGFPVADRPEAVRSFFAAVRRSCVGKTREKIPGMEEDEERVGSLLFFLAETDYVFLRPVPVPRNLFSSSSSASSSSPRDHHQLFDGVAFPFGYIQPRSDVVAPILERLFFSALLRPPPRGGEGGGGGENENKERKRKNSAADDNGASSSPSSPLAVPNTGPSPVLLPLSSWLRLLPAWVSFTEAIEKDLEAREVLGWIREMYAFSAAAAVSGVKLDLVPPPPPPASSSSSSVSSSSDGESKESGGGGEEEEEERRDPLILQPPEDEQLGNAAAIHYTWGTRIVEVEGGEGEEGVEGPATTTATATTTEPGELVEASSSEASERLVWEFDKRRTTEASAVERLPRPQELPGLFDTRWRLAGSKTSKGWKRGKRVSEALYETLKVQVREINACIDWIQESGGRAAAGVG